ncbi:MAG: hypothetical protein FWF70_07930 [Bacteroidetes bacterium]|nr:hypothetical protein [Bacteroidota bacterium]MCL1968828.1 hypothetical protein [Bacteroidota bacterium]
MNIFSPPTRVNISAEKLFNLSGNCRNFAHFLDEQAKDISATEDICSFTVENIARINLKILEKTPFTAIRFAAANDKNIPFFITLNYSVASENETDVTVNLDIDLPIFLRPVLQTPLQRFMNTLSEKIKNNAEKLEA